MGMEMNPGGAPEQESAGREPSDLEKIEATLRLFEQKRAERGGDVLEDEKVLRAATEAMRQEREAVERFRSHAPGSRGDDGRAAA